MDRRNRWSAGKPALYPYSWRFSIPSRRSVNVAVLRSEVDPEVALVLPRRAEDAEAELPLPLREPAPLVPVVAVDDDAQVEPTLDTLASTCAAIASGCP